MTGPRERLVTVASERPGAEDLDTLRTELLKATGLLEAAGHPDLALLLMRRAWCAIVATPAQAREIVAQLVGEARAKLGQGQ